MGQTLVAAAMVIGFAALGAVILYFVTEGLLYLRSNTSWQQLASVFHLVP